MLDLKSLNVNVESKQHLRFVEYLGRKGGRDIHLVKYRDFNLADKPEDKIAIIEDLEKPVWVTKKVFRTHRDKREMESVDKLDCIMTRESDVAKKVARALGLKKNPTLCQMRDVAGSPYVYGLGIGVSNYIKDWYMRNGKSSPLTLAVLDTEVNIENPDYEFMTHISISRKESSSLRVLRMVFDKHGYKNDDEIKAHIIENYKKYVPKGETTWYEKPRIIELCDNPKQMIENTFLELHRWNPDLLGIWNMDYDVSKLEIEWRDRLGLDMEDLYHNPTVPYQYRHYDYRRGSNVIKTVLDNGTIKTKTKNFHEVHHDLITSAGFKVVDMMGGFYQLRSQEPDIEGGFGLDNVLGKMLNIGKVKDDSKYVKREWHIQTLKHKPAFYSCYSQFDTDSMLLLEDKLGDLTKAIPQQLGASGWAILNSLPRRLHIAIHFFVRDLGYVVGTKDPNLERDAILGIGGGWIVTVPAFKKIIDGLNKIYESPGTTTSHYRMVYDMDEVSAYPYATVAANVSALTTMLELISIEGHVKSDFLKDNINLIINVCNSYLYAVNMLGADSFEELYDAMIDVGLITV